MDDNDWQLVIQRVVDLQGSAACIQHCVTVLINLLHTDCCDSWRYKTPNGAAKTNESATNLCFINSKEIISYFREEPMK
jgi:hypothetical protein